MSIQSKASVCLQATLMAAAQLIGAHAAARPLELRSPDGRIAATVSVTAEGQPTYSLRFNGETVLAPSVLGLAFERHRQLSAGMEVSSSEQSSGVDSYRLMSGKTSAVRSRYNQLVVHLVERAGERRRLDVVLRAYDEGLAFRYHIPAQPNLRELRLAGEKTEFAFPADYACQALNLGRFTTSHEGEYDAISASSFRYHHLYEVPVVCRTANGAAVAITEADLHDFAAMYLSGRESGELGLETRLSPLPDDPRIAVSAWVGEKGFATPWRVVMLGDRLADLVQSNLVASLNPAPVGDFSWVRPGKYAWDWWNGPTLASVPEAGMNDATLKAYIDFAGESGLEYMMIDDGWYVNSGGGATVLPGANNLETVPSIHLPELVRYAASKKVGLWLWVHWKMLDANMEQALPLYAAMGIKGIKVDFMDRDDQKMVEFYHRLLRTAAANRLMVNLHGAFAPRGLSRTWPNFLTQEGVFGAEYNKWTRRVTARHNVTLALTRMLLGPMDYTPGGFRNVTPERFRPEAATPMVQTTRGQALAMYVVFESAFQGVADSPDNYRGQPGFDFVRSVPGAWDETRAIEAVMGEQVVLARRKGREWFVGAMTNEQARASAIPLAFLPPGRFRATLWQDGNAPDKVEREERVVTARDTITLKLAPSGGGVIHLQPLP
jgi:alpha-glucosidase